jgi:hypothetical protein
MARIDVHTLVLAFEKRIEALEKNPPDKVPTSVIINMLESSIDDIIKNHFIQLIKSDLEKDIKDEFQKLKVSFIKKTIKNILSDDSFRIDLENKLKKKILQGIKEI